MHYVNAGLGIILVILAVIQFGESNVELAAVCDTREENAIHLADNAAAFNTINSFLIHSDLVSRGIRLNNNYNQTLGQVLIDVSPGSQIVSKPFNPPRVSADELAGTIKSTIRFWLTDQSNAAVDTNSEYWTARIVISFMRPIWI